MVVVVVVVVAVRVSGGRDMQLGRGVNDEAHFLFYFYY